MSSIRLLLVLGAISLFSFNVQARDANESMFLLKEALMESNGDYNKHKKKSNHEEFDRADEWSSRDTQAINIDQGLNHNQDLDEFQQVNKDFKREDREVSSHYATEDENSVLPADE